MPKTKKKIALTAGIAMFSMFFGSGNLVFPIAVGASTQSNFTFGALGLFISGILVPFLGIIGMTLYSGKREKFFNLLGSKTSFIITFAMLCLMGPFGVSARCVMVSFGGVQNIFPNLNLEIFSLIFCAIVGLLCWKQNKIVEIIGSRLTPWLIFSLLLILIAALIMEQDFPVSELSKKESFNEGLVTGYQMMDLLASFFFSAAIINFLKNNQKNSSDEEITKLSIKSSIIGMTLLGLFYIGLIYSGAKFSNILSEVSPEQLIITIAGHALGPIAKIIVGVTIALACLTTIIILTSLFAEFVTNDIFKKRINNKKLNKVFSRQNSLILTLIITYIISLSGFKTLSIYIGTILTIFYPALMVFVASSIIYKIYNINIVKTAFWLTSIACLIFNSNLINAI